MKRIGPMLLAVLMVGTLADAQTIFWTRDHVVDSTGATVAVATPASSDTAAPSTPTGLAASSITATSATLSWSASTDNVAVVGYRLYRGTALVAAVNSSTLSVADGTVQGGTTYSYKVAAFDAAGNQSALSSAVSVTALMLAPSSFSAIASSTSQVNLAWTASTGADHYVVERKTTGSWSQVGTPSGASYSDTSVSSSTTYLYRVKAVDSASNSSDWSSLDLATTIMFTDATLTAGSTAIKAAHITELRTAVNAVRATAGLSAASWTDSTLTAGTTVAKAVHVSELRSNLRDHA